jgi:hypothetical protein
MGHHQATLIIWGDHCTVYFVLSTLMHVVVVYEVASTNRFLVMDLNNGDSSAPVLTSLPTG